jgi:hypothetical protein
MYVDRPVNEYGLDCECTVCRPDCEGIPYGFDYEASSLDCKGVGLDCEEKCVNFVGCGLECKGCGWDCEIC